MKKIFGKILSLTLAVLLTLSVFPAAGLLPSAPLKAERTMGMRMPKVPHEVPVAKERPTAMRKMMAGRNAVGSGEDEESRGTVRTRGARFPASPRNVAKRYCIFSDKDV